MANRDFDKYFIDLTEKLGEMSTCNRGHVGCILVRDKRILSTGYAGAPSGLPHCDDVGHMMYDDHCIRTVHAEQNAIIQAAKHGIGIEGATAYTSIVPCFICAKMLVNAGVKKVVSANEYKNSDLTKSLFAAKKIDLIIFNDTLKY